MAKGVPSGYTRFLQRLLSELPIRTAGRPKLAGCLRGATLRRSDYEVQIPHPRMSSLLWAFRQNRLTKSRESKTFNVEFTPKRAYTLTPSAVQTVWRESGLDGEIGFDDEEAFFQIAWGYRNQPDQLVDDANLSNRLMDWAINAIDVAVHLVEGLRPTVDIAAGAERHFAGAPELGNAARRRMRLRLATEGLLEDLIIDDWSGLDFAAPLEYVDRQVHCGDIGIIDILARDQKSGSFVVIELKRDEGDDETFGQLCRYMGWVAKHKSQPDGAPVRGIIVAAGISPKLRSAASVNPNVRLIRYDVKIALENDAHDTIEGQR